MDFTTIVAGSAQAAHPPVSRPGIGLTAGAGPAPAADAAAADDFASLVALALDKPGGVSSTACHATAGERAADVLVDDGEGHDGSPLDVDAATLSLLIALATPVATPAATSPDAPPQVGSDLAVVDGDGADHPVAAAADAADTRAASRAGAAMAASPSFEDLLASSAAAPGATPDASAAASASGPIAAGTPETPADAPALAAQPLTAAAPSPAMVAPRGGQRPAAHPLREALAGPAAARAVDMTSTPGSQTAGTTSTPRTAASIASAPSVAPTSAPAIAGAHEARTPAASHLDGAAVAPMAAFAAASEAGQAGEGSSDGARDGFTAPVWTHARGAEPRFDAPPAVQASTTDGATGAALPALAGFGAAGSTMLRAIDMPAAARFEQTLSSVDPDVRNLQAMVRTVRLFTAADGAHEARLTLEPDHLGPVALTVRVEQGSVSAHFRAETPAAQRWIETHQQELRAGLREQGLEVKDVVVTTDPDGRRDRRQDAQPARPPRARRPHGADTPRFEILV